MKVLIRHFHILLSSGKRAADLQASCQYRTIAYLILQESKKALKKKILAVQNTMQKWFFQRSNLECVFITDLSRRVQLLGQLPRPGSC